MTDTSIPVPLTPARRIRLAEDVAEKVRTAILHGQFSPGQHLREDELATRLEVSRGPVREAFAILEREGLVDVAPHRGATVVQLTLDDLAEVYSLRTGLEVVATQLAVRRGTAEDFAQAEAVLAEFARALEGNVSEQDAARLDVEFHDVFYRAARNGRLYTGWLGVRSQVYLFLLERNIANQDWRRKSITGHTDILEAVRSRNEKLAVKLISGHISYAFSLLSSSYGDRSARLDLIPPRLRGITTD
jgi:DNA-binding GntR family transcriptional regulator